MSASKLSKEIDSAIKKKIKRIEKIQAEIGELEQMKSAIVNGHSAIFPAYAKLSDYFKNDPDIIGG